MSAAGTTVSVRQSSDGTGQPAVFEHSIRNLLDICEALPRRKRPAVVLLLVDDLHNTTPADASSMTAPLQEIIKTEERRLGFIGAGLPHMVRTLLRHEGFVFFGRCNREYMKCLSHDAVCHALIDPLRAHGISIPDGLVPGLSRATMGVGFAVQAMGKHLWALAGGAGAASTVGFPRRHAV